jgi:hypothetical protein
MGTVQQLNALEANMDKRNEQSPLKRMVSNLVNKFFAAFIFDENNVSLQQMNAYMSYTSGFWMMDAGYVGDYHTVTQVYEDKMGN